VITVASPRHQFSKYHTKNRILGFNLLVRRQYGFFMAFFQSCWDVIGLDVIKVFLEFHQRGKFEKSFNATFITLIPKKVRVVEVKNFRPISLGSGIYKIIAKTWRIN
jgi:hypothetical protein